MRSVVTCCLSLAWPLAFAQSDVRPVVQLGHTNGVGSVLFSPDNRLLATGGKDETVVIWDLRIGGELSRLIRRDPFNMWLGSLGGGKSKEEKKDEEDHQDQIKSFARLGQGAQPLAFSPDGKTLLTIHPDSSVRRWNTATGEELAKLPMKDPPAMSGPALSGSYAEANAMGKILKLVEAAKFDMPGPLASMVSMFGSMNDMQIPNLWSTSQLFALSGDGTRSIRVLPDGEDPDAPKPKRGRWDPRRLIPGIGGLFGGGGGGQIGDLAGAFAKELLKNTEKLKGYSVVVENAFDGREIVKLGGDKPMDGRHITRVAMAPKGDLAAVALETGTVQIFDTATGVKQQNDLIKPKGYIDRLFFSPKGTYLCRSLLHWDGGIGFKFDRKFAVHRVSDGALVFETTIPGGRFFPDQLSLVKISADETTLVAAVQQHKDVQGSDDPILNAMGTTEFHIRRWNFTDGKPEPSNDIVSQFGDNGVLSEDGRYLLADRMILDLSKDSANCVVGLVDKGLASISIPSESVIEDGKPIGVSRNGMLAFATGTSTVRCVEAKTGNLLYELRGLAMPVNVMQTQGDNLLLGGGAASLIELLAGFVPIQGLDFGGSLTALLQGKRVMAKNEQAEKSIRDAKLQDPDLVFKEDVSEIDLASSRVLNLSDARQFLADFSHKYNVGILGSRSDGSALSIGGDRTISIWNLESDNRVFSPKTPENFIPVLASFDKDNPWVLGGQWNVKKEKDKLDIEAQAGLYMMPDMIRILEIKDDNAMLGKAGVTPDGKTILIPSEKKIIKLNLADMKKIQKSDIKDRDIQCLSRDARIATAVNDKDQSIRVFDPITNKDICKTTLTVSGGNRVVPTFIEPDERLERIAIGYGVNRLAVIDAKTGATIQQLEGHTDVVRCAKFVGQDRLISGSWDGSVRLWNLPEKREVLRYYPVGREDWIVMIPDGHYMASRTAYDAIMYRKDGQGYPFETYDLRFNRPDLVLLQLGYEKSDIIDAYHNAYLSRLSRLKVDDARVQNGDSIPVTEILNKASLPAVSSKGIETLHVRVGDPSGPGLSSVLVWANEVPLPVNVSVSGSSWEGDIPVTLASGRNRIQVASVNSSGVQSIKDTVTIQGPAGDKPTLYVLAVGVSKYAAGGPGNLKFADKDASDIFASFQSAAPGMGMNFSSKLVPVLNESATKANIMAAATILKESKPDDMVVVFFAGHGDLDGGTTYFEPHDAHHQNLAEKGLKFDDVDHFFDGVAARRRLVLFDACHSGENTQVSLTPQPQDGWTPVPDLSLAEGVFVRSETKSFSSPAKLRRIYDLYSQSFANLNRTTGAFAIAACSGFQVTVERATERNGLFTHLLLQALNNPAQAEFDQRPGLSVAELRRYVFREMPKLAKDAAQTPSSRQENLSYNFRVK